MMRILVGIMLSAALVGCGSRSTPTRDDSEPYGGPKGDPKVGIPKKVRPTETVAVKAEDLYKEYTANKKAAEAKYAGKLIAVTGVVLNAGTDNAGEVPMVVLECNPNNVASIIQCVFPATAEKGVLALAEGQTVRINGVIEPETFGIGVPLLDCEIAEAGKSPAAEVTAAGLTKAAADNRDSAIEKYNYKPIFITGVVAEVKKEGTSFYFSLKGHDDKSIVKAHVLSPISKKVIDSLNAVKKGDTIKVKGKMSLLADPFEVSNATLIK